MEKVNITIVGAGVVGLAVAYELSKAYKDILVIEKNTSFGQETSSRNSEVIHAGIYYPKDSFKAKACIEGRELLYAFCKQYNIAHKKLGKLIVAIDDSETKDLEALFKLGKNNGIEDLDLFSKTEIKNIEPYIEAESAIYSPSTGILDTHSFMKALVWQVEEKHGQIAYNSELIVVDKAKDGFEVTVQDTTGDSFKFSTRILINCAGLNSDKVSAIAGVVKEEYKLKYCKGDYFRVVPAKAKFIQHLVYPVPKKRSSGLGIHVTLDLAGGMRLGPDDEYVDKINYDIDVSKRKIFYESVMQFLPFIKEEDIIPDTSGIRPKLQGAGEDFRDFVIKDESASGFPGLINLIGIESPGFTASLSIAKITARLVR